MKNSMIVKHIGNTVSDMAIHSTGTVPDIYFFNKEFEDRIHYLQSIDWYEFHSDEQFIVGTFVDGLLVARSVITVKNLPLGVGAIYRAERGPTAIDSSSMRLHIEQLCKLSKQHGILLEISPYSESETTIKEIGGFLTDNGWKGVNWTRNYYRSSIVLDLAPEIEEIKKRFRKSLKRWINKASKSDLRCEFVSEDFTLDSILRLYNETARKRGFKVLSSCDREFIKTRTRDKSMTVCAIFIGNECVGANIMVPMGEKILVEWRVFSDTDEHRKFPLAHYADWQSINWAKNEGYSQYDFSGYWEEFGDTNSINRYKTGFTKNIVPVMPEFDYVKNGKFIYFLVRVRRWQKKIRTILARFKITTQFDRLKLATNKSV